MNHWQKLGLPVGLGLCAAFLNWSSVRSKLEPKLFVAVASEAPAGSLLGTPAGAKLIPVSISYCSNTDLKNVLIPWESVNAVNGRYCDRNIAAGGLVTQYDIRERNVVPLDTNREEEFTLQMTLNERDAGAYYVNDYVNVRHKRNKCLTHCRILSIVREKEGYRVTLGVNPHQLQSLERTGYVPSELHLAGHCTPDQVPTGSVSQRQPRSKTP